MNRQNIINYCLKFTFSSVSYFIAMILGLTLATINKSSSPIWPASGIAFLLIYKFGFKYIPAILFSSTLGNYLSGSNLFTSILIGTGNSLEVYFILTLMPIVKQKVKNLDIFNSALSLSISSAIGCAVSASIGTLALYIANIVKFETLFYNWITWWMGNLLGVLIIAPFFLTILEKEFNINTKKIFLNYLPIITCSLAISYFLFSSSIGFYFLFITFAFVFIILKYTDKITVYASITLLYSSCIYFTNKNLGPFYGSNINQNFINMQIYFAALILSAMIFEELLKKNFYKNISGFLFISWIATSILLTNTINHEKRIEREEFEKTIHYFHNIVSDRLLKYEASIRSSAAFMSISKNINSIQWKDFVNTLGINKYLPGMNGMGVITTVKSKDIKSFESLQNKNQKRNFKVHTVLNNPIDTDNTDKLHYIITYIEPYENNISALGLAISSETRRKTAAEKSRKLNTPTITDIITLVQDNDKGPGLLYFAPIIDKNESFYGWIYSPMIGKKLFEDIFTNSNDNFKLNVSYKNSDNKFEYLFQDINENHTYSKSITTKLNFADREFLLDWKTSTPYSSSIGKYGSIIILVSQLMLLLIVSVFTIQNIINQKAQDLANIFKSDLEKSQQTLINSSKMSALGEMASSMAHEINNPLSVIVTKSELLERLINSDKFTKEKGLELLQSIKRTSVRISNIISGLRSFSRNSEKDPLQEVNSNDLINHTLELCKERILHAGIKLEILDNSNYKIRGKESQLIQVLLNLLNNSYDAVCNLENKWIKISTKLEDKYVVISIIDSGEAISNEVKEKMMQPFFTTKSVGNGTGLGLSISKGIIESHHGSLNLNTSSTHTRFDIKLPIT